VSNYNQRRVEDSPDKKAPVDAGAFCFARSYGDRQLSHRARGPSVPLGPGRVSARAFGSPPGPIVGPPGGLYHTCSKAVILPRTIVNRTPVSAPRHNFPPLRSLDRQTRRDQRRNPPTRAGYQADGPRRVGSSSVGADTARRTSGARRAGRTGRAARPTLNELTGTRRCEPAGPHLTPSPPRTPCQSQPAGRLRFTRVTSGES